MNAEAVSCGLSLLTSWILTKIRRMACRNIKAVCLPDASGKTAMSKSLQGKYCVVDFDSILWNSVDEKQKDSINQLKQKEEYSTIKFMILEAIKQVYKIVRKNEKRKHLLLITSHGELLEEIGIKTLYYVPSNRLWKEIEDKLTTEAPARIKYAQYQRTHILQTKPASVYDSFDELSRQVMADYKLKRVA